ncbi:MAG: PAS domain S-box protein [Acidobacteriia bacterium]|nr:PAS domain S-box protein [Terriglobia bacterium]
MEPLDAILQAAALNSAANGIVITDRHGSIVWANPALTTFTGYTLDEVLGRTPGILRSGTHDQSFYESLWATILAGTVWQGEISNRRRDGSLYTEEMTITPVRAEGREITHFIAIKQDITERKRLEEQVLRAQKLESIARLAGGVAHDFNNLLVGHHGVQRNPPRTFQCHRSHAPED